MSQNASVHKDIDVCVYSYFFAQFIDIIIIYRSVSAEDPLYLFFQMVDSVHIFPVAIDKSDFFHRSFPLI